MKIEVLGSGGLFDEFGTSFLVNDHILIDCGVEVTKELIQTGRAAQVKHLVLTHLHCDHAGGLDLLMFYKRVVQGALRDFTIWAGSDFAGHYNSLPCSRAVDGTTNRMDFSNMSLPHGKIFSILGVEFTPYLVEHAGVEAYAFRMYENASNATCLYSGDVDQPLDLENYGTSLTSRSRTLLIHDMGGEIQRGVPRFHPTEDEVYRKYGESPYIVGVHTMTPLSYYVNGRKGDVYYIERNDLHWCRNNDKQAQDSCP